MILRNIGISLDVAKEPVVSMCYHLFCWSCLHTWLETRPMRQNSSHYMAEAMLKANGRGSGKLSFFIFYYLDPLFKQILLKTFIKFIGNEEKNEFAFSKKIVGQPPPAAYFQNSILSPTYLSLSHQTESAFNTWERIVCRCHLSKISIGRTQSVYSQTCLNQHLL